MPNPKRDRAEEVARAIYEAVYHAACQHNSPFACRPCKEAAIAGGLHAYAAERMRAVADEWARAYGLPCFPEPPKGEHAATVDGCSARMGRHLAATLRAAAEEERKGE